MSRTKHHRNLSRRQNMQTPPADYRRDLNAKGKAKVKAAMQKGDWDNIPAFKSDALYNYL